MARKTYEEKLNDSKDMPIIKEIPIDSDYAKRNGHRMLIAPPLTYYEIMARVPYGKLVTVDKIRDYLAKNAGADFTCPLTAGLFINICANASYERVENQIPYWRTLKARGELNIKFPNAYEEQIDLLEKEGHKVVQRGKRYFVEDFEKDLWQIQ